MGSKCNRTVCNNIGLHKHKWNGQFYCSECVFAIEENVILFGDERCFDITRDQARALILEDKIYEEQPNDR